MRRALSLLLLLAAVPACVAESPPSLGDGSAPTDARGQGGGLRVTWRAETRVFDEAEVRTLLIDRFAADGVYRFRWRPGLEDELTPSRVIVLRGVNLVRVVSAQREGDELRVRVEPAALEDAAEEADLEWSVDHAVPTFGEPPPTHANGLAPQGVSTITPDGDSASFTGSFNGVDVTAQLTRSSEGMSAYATVAWESGTNRKASLVTSATAQPIQARGRTTVRGGQLRSFQVDFDSLDVEFEVDIGLVQSGTDILKRLGIPLRGYIPFIVGGIPMYLAIGLEVEVESQLGELSTMFFGARCSLKGAGGVAYDAETRALRPHGALSRLTCKSVAKDYVAAGANYGAAVRVDFPKISLGAGLARTAAITPDEWARVEGYLSVRHEALVNVRVKRGQAGPYEVVEGQCGEIDTAEAVFAGGGFRFGGAALSEEIQLAGRGVDHLQFGNKCD